MYLIRYSEIGLKGQRARKNMEKELLHNITVSLSPFGEFHFTTVRGRIFLETSIDEATVLATVSTIFGVKSVSPVMKFQFETLEDIIEYSDSIYRDLVSGKKFVVRSRRSGNHTFSSLDVERRVGERLLSYSKGVSLKNPDLTVSIEIRDNAAYFFTKTVKGPGGLPIPTQGKMIALMSGGIDSPVASWYMMKRGVLVSPLFISLAHPVDTVSFLDSAGRLFERWSNGRNAKVFVVDGRSLIDFSLNKGKLKYPNVTFKRVIYQIAQRLAVKHDFHGIITGESLGQVSSQTYQNLEALTEGMVLPVYRPLIGFDKDEISDMARRIGTFPENDPGEFCSLFSDHPAIGVSREELSRDIVPEEMIGLMCDTAIMIDSERIGEYRKELQKDDLKSYEVDTDSLVIDMRGKEDYRREHYPGSVNVSLNQLDEYVRENVHDRSVVLYCKKGLQSAYAASLLRDKGLIAYYTDEKILKKIK